MKFAMHPGKRDEATCAELICFPQDRNVGKVRKVAATYANRPTRAARNGYWIGICSTLAAVMRRRGFSEAEIARQTDAFHHAVEAELFALASGQTCPPKPRP